MIRIRPGVVVEIHERRPGISELLVEVDGRMEKAVSYDDLTGEPTVGDRVVLNTSAVKLGLGTGGVHFVMLNLEQTFMEVPSAGHIMKMRYTPFQVQVLAVDEEEGPGYELLRDCETLDGTPVVVGTLHSMVGPFAAAVKLLAPDLRVVYLMTDGGALPLPFSRLVHQLRHRGLLHATVTCGHAFGGDYEAVNVYSGLLAARAVAGADVVIAAMGPGIVGTGQTFGFSGIEQGEIINAAGVLGGLPIAIPRLSFADARERHQGVSHHTLTALGRVALVRAVVSVPRLEGEAQRRVEGQLDAAGISARHEVVVADGAPALEALARYDLEVTTMGRGPRETPEFFLACGAAARVAVDACRAGRQDREQS
ncbi:MAG: DUF3866 family protein [Candidatus Desulforudis sp.]|nr:DUF3866 family protein [Desulforudis sp.]